MKRVLDLLESTLWRERKDLQYAKRMMEENANTNTPIQNTLYKVSVKRSEDAIAELELAITILKKT